MSPLSELVWSPDDGLSIKIAASSLSTRKASLRWNADTLNIVISSPQQSGGGGKSGDNVDATLRDAGEMPSQPRTRSDSSVRVSAASPNRTRNLDAQQSTSIRSSHQGTPPLPSPDAPGPTNAEKWPSPGLRLAQTKHPPGHPFMGQSQWPGSVKCRDTTNRVRYTPCTGPSKK